MTASKIIPRLGVNLDHVATVRQARGELYPEVTRAAQLVLQAGVPQITLHLREDRRHIQDHDIKEVLAITHQHNALFNFEMGMNEQIVKFALECRPDWICLVPENRQERTTEGGLNLRDPEVFAKIKATCESFKLHSPKTKISLFVESNLEVMNLCSKLSIHAVEIHTGDYAHFFNSKKSDEQNKVIHDFIQAQKFCLAHNIGFHAGHGLTLANVKPLLEANLFSEYNIGHWIISESLFSGIVPVVKSFLNLFSQYHHHNFENN